MLYNRCVYIFLEGKELQDHRQQFSPCETTELFLIYRGTQPQPKLPFILSQALSGDSIRHPFLSVVDNRNSILFQLSHQKT